MVKQRCQCIKRNGTQCTRMPDTKKSVDARFCWQHQKCSNLFAAAAKVEKVKDQTVRIQVPNKMPVAKEDPAILDGVAKIICEQLPEIKKKKLLGQGSFGKVYLHCLISSGNEPRCEYAVKIQEKCTMVSLVDLFEEKKITNKLSNAGLAPKIHQIVRCPGDICMMLMDLVTGRTYNALAEEGLLAVSALEDLVAAVDRMHKIAKHGHGDLSFGNIIRQDDGKIIFIDISPEDKMRPAAYDYGTWLWYIPYHCRNTLDIFSCIFLYETILERLRPFKDNLDVEPIYTKLQGVIERMEEDLEIDSDALQELAEMSVDVFFFDIF